MHAEPPPATPNEIAREIAFETIRAAHADGAPGLSRALVTSKIERLVHFLMAAYPADITLGEAQKVFVEEGDKLSVDYLDTLRPAAVPLAIMRELLSARGLTFDVRGAPSWARFVERYGAAIRAVDRGPAGIGDAATSASGPTPLPSEESRGAPCG